MHMQYNHLNIYYTVILMVPAGVVSTLFADEQ